MFFFLNGLALLLQDALNNVWNVDIPAALPIVRLKTQSSDSPHPLLPGGHSIIVYFMGELWFPGIFLN